jgi:hypothetical protein
MAKFDNLHWRGNLWERYAFIRLAQEEIDGCNCSMSIKENEFLI